MGKEDQFKRQRVCCGLVCLSVQGPDPDLNPDDSTLQEKLEVLDSWGIKMPVECKLCACMTETELYFAPFGATPSQSSTDDEGEEPLPLGPEGLVSSRNEMRALSHLSKLLAAPLLTPASPTPAEQQCRAECRRRVVGLAEKIALDGLPGDQGVVVADEGEARSCEEFEAWCGAEGVTTALTVRDFPGTGRGLAAARNLEAGEVVVKTPFHLFLNTEDLASTRFAHVFRGVRGLDQRSEHILLVMMEKADCDRSPWKPYINSCPRSLFNGLLLPDEHLALLEGSPALDFLVERKTEFRTLYDDLFPKLSQAFPKELPRAKCGWEDFVWAAALIDTRAWATEAGCDVSSLVPCADMMNHHRCAQGMVKRYSSDEGYATVQLLSPVAEGTQVYIYYGELTTASQLVRFGFADPDDPQDTVPFELDTSEMTPEQRAAMDAWGLRPDTQQLLRRGTTNSQRLLAMLRILHLDADEDKNCLSDIQSRARCPRGRVSDANEANVVATLVSLVEAMQKAYPSDLASDLEAIAGGGLDEGARSCLNHVVSQKRVLCDALAAARALVT